MNNRSNASVSGKSACGAATSSNGQVVSVLWRIALLWIVSSYFYYAFVSLLGVESGYSDAPVFFAAYYLLWAGAAAFLFRALLIYELNIDNIWRSAVLLIPILAAFGLFVTVFLPVLPNVSVLRAPDDPPEFMFASAWYYLSKSADILFQQILVMALILTAAKAQFRIVTIGLYIAIAFGGMHLMLSLDGFIPLYVARFTIAATLFGLVLPFIYLRMRDGFVWAYGLHWSFYAIDATLTHLLLASPPWAQS